VKKTSLVIGLALVLVLANLYQAPAYSNSPQQADPGITTTQVFGDITAINAAGGVITVKTAAGSIVAVNVSEKTTYQRVPPGETSLANAVESSLTEIAVGDRIVARGYVASDRKSVPAQKIYVVSQSDIAKRNAAQRQAWARGTKGIVSAINPEAKEITVTSRSLAGTSQAVTVAVDKAKLKRYPPDSIPKYETAKAAKFEEIKVGDQLNARGEKNPEGTHVSAEEVVFGTFLTNAGSVVSIDLPSRPVTVKELGTGKNFVIKLTADSNIKQMPAMAAGPRGTVPAGGGPPPAGAVPPGGRGGPPNLSQIVENLPVGKLDDIKPGSAVVVSSTKGAQADQVTAILLVTNADLLIQMATPPGSRGGVLTFGSGGGGAGLGVLNINP